MGSDPLATPFLIGCGLREFSIVSSDIPALKARVANHSITECEALAAECIKLSSSQAIKALLEAFLKEH